MYLTSLLTTLLLASNVWAKSIARVAKPIAGGTGLQGCGPNKDIVPGYVELKKSLRGDNITIVVLGLTSTKQIEKATGYLYAYDAHDLTQLDEVEFDLCSGVLINDKCPIEPEFFVAVAEFDNAGHAMKDVDMGVDIFLPNGEQALCLYGGATGGSKNPGRGGVVDGQQATINIRLEM